MARQTRSTGTTDLELFLDMLAAERGAGPNTLTAYTRDLEDFSDYLVTKKRAIADATTEHVRGYLRHLAKREFAASSVARRLSAIRQLYRFLYAEGRRGDDPAAIVEGPKRGRKLPRVLSIEEVDRLLDAAHHNPKPNQTAGERARTARLYCLLELVYATGLRVSELVSLPASTSPRIARLLIVGCNVIHEEPDAAVGEGIDDEINDMRSGRIIPHKKAIQRLRATVARASLKSTRG